MTEMTLSKRKWTLLVAFLVVFIAGLMGGVIVRRSTLRSTVAVASDTFAEYRKPKNQRLIDEFHRLYYYSTGTDKEASSVFWLGIPVWKNPMDLWVMQEIISETKPDVIIEAGTYKGGSAFYLTKICDLLDHGRIISLDINDFPDKPQHKRITYLVGDDVAESTVEKVKALIRPGETVMVDLDDGHESAHVLQELEIYGKLVTKGNYLIVEDTNLGTIVATDPGHFREHGGPQLALQEFLKRNNDFVPDSSREKFLLTFNRGGYLRKTR